MRHLKKKTTVLWAPDFIYRGHNHLFFSPLHLYLLRIFNAAVQQGIGRGAIKTDDVTAAQLHRAESASNKKEADSEKTREAENEKVWLPKTQETNVYLKSVALMI